MSALPTTDPARSVLLRHVSWNTYCALLNEVGDDAVRLTYDGGLLEIEVPSERHEQLKKFVGSLIEASLDAELRPYQPLGSTTWKREDPLKGIEADECYYVQSLPSVRGRPIDLTVDPPPDLAVEADLGGTAIDKLSVYRALGVPEVWRVLESGEAEFHHLVGGQYRRIERSEMLPRLTPQTIKRFADLLPPVGTLVHSEALIQFRRWLAAPPAVPGPA